LVFAEKWPRMHQVLIQGRAPNTRPPPTPFQWRSANSVLVRLPPPDCQPIPITPVPHRIHASLHQCHGMASQCFYRPPQMSWCLLLVRALLLYSLPKRLHVYKALYIFCIIIMKVAVLFWCCCLFVFFGGGRWNCYWFLKFRHICSFHCLCSVNYFRSNCMWNRYIYSNIGHVFIRVYHQKVP